MGDSVEKRMQDAAERQLEHVEEAFWALETDPQDQRAQQAAGLWCGGCHTCYAREVLDAAVPILIEAIRSGEFDLAAVGPMSNVHHFPGGRQ